MYCLYLINNRFFAEQSHARNAVFNREDCKQSGTRATNTNDRLTRKLRNNIRPILYVSGDLVFTNVYTTYVRRHQ